MTNWYMHLQRAANKRGEKIEELVHTMTDKELHEKFDDGFGSASGCAFTAWGKNWVYFPIVYDGAEWVGSAPRNPCGTKLKHQGGQ